MPRSNMSVSPLPSTPSGHLPPHPRSRRSSSVWDYEQSIMFGQYREDLANFALEEAEKLKKLRDSNGAARKRKRKKTKKKVMKRVSSWRCWEWLRAICNFGGDMIFFTTLAITLAVLSFVMDCIVHQFHHFRHYLIHDVTDIFALNYLFWVLYMLSLVLVSAIVTRVFAPQAAGSGVSEMKVVLRGVILKEYLSLKTLLTKLVGETFTLASGIYLGKEGPFVHIASMCANQFMKVFYRISDPAEYESRFFEIIAVACGLGVAVTFASPVGGVLYSIEIVSVFFSVRSYWHGFFAATIGALFWRLLTVWFGIEETITPLFKTTFRLENPYETLEMISFVLLGFVCGLFAAAYIALNRQFVLFNRRKNRVNAFLNRWPLLYPGLITVGVALVTYPGAFGQYFTSYLTHDQAIRELFSNYTWYSLENTIDHDPVLDNWHTPHTSVFVNTFLFFLMNIVLIAICTTLPIPGGIIVPSFKIGAGLGRFFGEGMAWLFPNGVNPMLILTNQTIATATTKFPILAGTYAVVGSAAFAGANTGAMSSAMIAFEMTGQITHLLPVIVATLVATITARYFGPSIYDSLIILKKLPYLPSILPSSSSGHRIFVEDFMERDLLFVWSKCTYRHLQNLLNSKKQLRMFPFVKSPKSMILLGTIERSELQYLLDSHLSRAQMIAEFRTKSSKSLNNIPGSAGGTDQASGTNLSGSQNFGSQLLRSARFQVSPIAEAGEDEVERKAVCSNDWEQEQLDQMVDFGNCPIDPAPFQLMEGTSLIKVHNLFSLLGLQLAYVTSLGTLVGVISLRELGKIIEDMNSDIPQRNRTRSISVREALREEEEEEEDDDDDDSGEDGSDVEMARNNGNGNKKNVTIELPKGGPK